ncbi:MAG: hypothetical protein PHI37_00635 [Candidatus Gracilibacteria bacterium]|nr:hypothetical protein [Candidatus Gracilibacteria bacterium]
MGKEINLEAFRKAGLSYEEIQDIIESEKDFKDTGITYDFEEVKKLARKELFSKQKTYV